MSNNDNIIDRLAKMEENMIAKLEMKIDAKIFEIADKTLQKHHEEISNNTKSILEINEKIEPIKNDVARH